MSRIKVEEGYWDWTTQHVGMHGMDGIGSRQMKDKKMGRKLVPRLQCYLPLPAAAVCVPAMLPIYNTHNKKHR